MSEIPNEIEDFYNSIDNLESLNIWNIQKEISIINQLEKEWEDNLLIERKVFNFNINNGELASNILITDGEGGFTKITFDKKEIKYLKNRLLKTNNPWLKSRYSHIIWQETKHNDFAEIAINNYIQTINNIKDKEVNELSIILSAILFISRKSKKKIDEAKELALYLVNELINWAKPSIIRCILESNLFTKEELKEIGEKIPSWIENKNLVSYYHNKDFLLTGIDLYNKLNLPLNNLYKLLADNEDLILRGHPEDTDFVKFTIIGQKAKYLHQAGDEEEYKECLKEYNRLKQKVKLGSVRYEADEKITKMFNDYLNVMSKEILKLPSENILAFFSFNQGILVDPNQNREYNKKSIKNSLYDVFNTSVFDINSNVKDLKDSEKIDRQIIQSYTISYGIRLHSLFLKVFTEGVISGKLNYYKVFEFLEKHTWYGTKFNRSITENELDKNSNWLSMLAPGIHNLFAQFEFSVIMNTNKINNFILALDSLTIKFEGVLRDFIRLSGGSTTTVKRGELKEQLLEELLENEITKKYFTIKDIELFKYALTQKGRNLRNNIAHSFLQYSDYDLQSVVLVFLCLLRLGKYTFKEENN